MTCNLGLQWREVIHLFIPCKVDLFAPSNPSKAVITNPFDRIYQDISWYTGNVYLLSIDKRWRSCWGMYIWCGGRGACNGRNGQQLHPHTKLNSLLDTYGKKTVKVPVNKSWDKTGYIELLPSSPYRDADKFDYGCAHTFVWFRILGTKPKGPTGFANTQNEDYFDSIRFLKMNIMYNNCIWSALEIIELETIPHYYKTE